MSYLSLSTKTLHDKFPDNIILTRFQPLTGEANVGHWGGGAICSTAGAIAPPVNMLDEALPRGPTTP